ncbi:MAG TPA: DUF401 family protein [Dictyoglomaceae bacterium]|nr:DUF401 family protein [Dictyoglomaceae bacterium]
MIALLKVCIIFGIIVVLISKKFPLVWALLGGSIIMGLSFGLPFSDILKGVFEGVIAWDTIKLALILYLIAVVENILRNRDLLKNMISSIKSLIKEKRLLLISMPMILGLLPSVGGALFSAPLLEEAGKDTNLDPERKSYINYWFRHVWEPFLPVYPGILLASVLSETSLSILIREALPYGLLVLAIGLFFAFYKLDLSEKAPEENSEEAPDTNETPIEENSEENPNTDEAPSEEIKNPLKTFLISFSPILALLLITLIFHIDLLYVLLGLILALFLIFRYNFQDIKNTLKDALKPENVLLIVAVMIFKRMLEVTSAVSDIAYLLNYSNIPIVISFFTLPFITGLLTGSTQASVGISFPILLRMIPYQNPLKYIIFGFISSYFGVLMSPMHLCLIITKEYYKADWNKLYSYVIKSGIVFVIFLFLKFFLS